MNPALLPASVAKLCYCHPQKVGAGFEEWIDEIQEEAEEGGVGEEQEGERKDEFPQASGDREGGREILIDRYAVRPVPLWVSKLHAFLDGRTRTGKWFGLVILLLILLSCTNSILSTVESICPIGKNGTPAQTPKKKHHRLA